MIEDKNKLIISAIMWGILGAISIGTLINVNNMNIGDIAVAIIVVVPLVIALFGTMAIWSPELLMEDKDAKKQPSTIVNYQSSKSKNQPSSKLALLMEMMDEHEQEAFKETLRQRVLEDATITSDGELSVDDLFYQDAGYQSEQR